MVLQDDPRQITINMVLQNMKASCQQLDGSNEQGNHYLWPIEKTKRLGRGEPKSIP